MFQARNIRREKIGSPGQGRRGGRGRPGLLFQDGHATRIAGPSQSTGYMACGAHRHPLHENVCEPANALVFPELRRCGGSCGADPDEKTGPPGRAKPRLGVRAPPRDRAPSPQPDRSFLRHRRVPQPCRSPGGCRGRRLDRGVQRRQVGLFGDFPDAAIGNESMSCKQNSRHLRKSAIGRSGMMRSRLRSLGPNLPL